MPYCQNCGSEVGEDWRQCTMCGAELAPMPPTGDRKREEVTEQQAPPAGPTFLQAGTRYLLGFGEGYYGIWDGEAPGPAVERFPRTESGLAAARERFASMEPEDKEAEDRSEDQALPKQQGDSHWSHRRKLVAGGLASALVVVLGTTMAVVGSKSGGVHPNPMKVSEQAPMTRCRALRLAWSDASKAVEALVAEERVNYYSPAWARRAATGWGPVHPSWRRSQVLSPESLRAGSSL
jgi:hypothetical protein